MRVCLFVLAAFAAGAALADGVIVQRPPSATEYRESTEADFGIWFDSANWKPNPHPLDLFDLELVEVGGKASARLHVERDTVPFSSLAESALARFRMAGPNVKIVGQQTRLLAGKEVLYLTFDAFAAGGHTALYCCYYTGPEGTVQVVTQVPEGSPARSTADAEALLDGLQIGKPGETPPSRPASAPGAAASPPLAAETNIAELNAKVPYIDSSMIAAKEIIGGDVSGGAGKLEALAAKGDVKAMALLALCYDEGKGVPKDPAKAVTLMTRAAATQFGAMEILGKWYAGGHDVPKDLEKAKALLTKAAPEVPAAETSLGELAFTSDPVAAVDWFRKAAEQGNAEGEYCLAACYGNGTGLARDEGAKIKWLQKAAAHGYPKAEYLLAADYFNGLEGLPRNLEAAAGLIRKVAATGDAAAENDLGAFLWSGSGVAMNQEEAMHWYQKAADQGMPKAEHSLASIYWKGEGVPKDPERAEALFQQAAAQGDAFCQSMMGYFYFNGVVVAKDPGQGKQWFEKAAAQGEVRAEAALAAIDLTGIGGFPVNIDEAVKWAQKAAAGGSPGGALELAKLYTEGKGVEVDKAKAFNWGEYAASKGITQAQLNTGLCLIGGIGVEKNPEEGLEWIRKAADAGDANAEFQLGLYYAKGILVPADPVEATKWFRFSALQGNARGENAYGYSLAIGHGIEPDLVEALKWYLLASGPDAEAAPKRDATINMNNLLPRLTPDQVEEAKQRAREFVPEKKQQAQPDSLSFGVS